MRDPGVKMAELLHIDAVLISHNHYDHLDVDTLQILQQKFQPQFFTALGDGKLLNFLGIQKLIEMDWWQKQDLKGAEIHFL